MKKTILIITVLLTLAFSEGVAVVDAQTQNDGGTGSVNQNDGGTAGSGSITIPNPLGDITLTQLFQTLLEILLVFAIPIVVFFIIYAGFLYVTARGNADTITQAHRALLYALIGGVLILGANVLIEVIQGTVDAVTED